MRSGTPYLPGIRYTNIVTRDDEIVTPYTAGLLPGPRGTHVTDIVLQQGCPVDRSGHLALTASPSAAALVLGAAAGGSPGPLVSHFSGKDSGDLPCPVMIIPGSLSEERLEQLS